MVSFDMSYVHILCGLHLHYTHNMKKKKISLCSAHNKVMYENTYYSQCIKESQIN